MIVVDDVYYNTKPMCLTTLDLKILHGFGMEKSNEIVKLIKIPMKRKPYKWLEILGDSINDPRDWGFEGDNWYYMLWHDVAVDYKNNCRRIEPHFGELDSICWVRETFYKNENSIFYHLESKTAVKFLRNFIKKSSTHMRLEHCRSLIKIHDINVIKIENIWFYKVKIRLFANKVNGKWRSCTIQ